MPVWRILTYVSGTCVKGIALDPVIWLTMATYAGVRVASRLANDDADIPVAVDLLSKSDINVLGGFLSFFLVLFVNQTNTRFLEMYGFSKACSGRTQDVAGLASTQLPLDLAEQIIRHMNAAQIAGYVGLGGPYSKRHFFDHYNKVRVRYVTTCTSYSNLFNDRFANLTVLTSPILRHTLRNSTS